MEIRSVLLIDDEPDIRTIAELALSDVGGWEVSLAESGQDALTKLAQGLQPDVILLDVMMPIMDGPTTLQQLRSREINASVPVIFMTAKAQRREVDQYLALGASGVITKPFDPMTLAQEVRRIVAGL